MELENQDLGRWGDLIGIKLEQDFKTGDIYMSANKKSICSIHSTLFGGIPDIEKSNKSDKEKKKEISLTLLHLMAQGVVVKPDICASVEAIPVKSFEVCRTLGEGILVYYQKHVTNKLSTMEAGEDCSEFVEGVKKNVAELNKIFNNVEKVIDLKNNSKDIFKRDKELNHDKSRSV